MNWNKRLLGPLVGLLLLAMALPCAAVAQLPGTGSLVETPKITIGNTQSTQDKVQKILNELQAREEVLLDSVGEAAGWKRDLVEAQLRVEALLKRRQEVEALEAEFPDTKNALSEHYEALLRVSRDLSEDLAYLVEIRDRELFEVQEGLRHAHRLLRQLDAPAGGVQGGDERSLDDVLLYLSDLRTAQIEVSLLKARRAGLNEEMDKTLEEGKGGHVVLPQLDSGMAESKALAVVIELRQQMKQLGPVVDTFKVLLRKQVAAHIDSQLQRTRLLIYEKEDDLEQREAQREQIFLSLDIEKRDLDDARRRLDSSVERLHSEETELRGKLKELRMSPPGDEGIGTFSKHKEWQVRLTVLQHRLYLLDVESQAEELRAAGVGALYNLLKNQAPPKGFEEEYKYYLDAGRQERARDELDKRREAWRQEYARLSGETPAAGEKGLARKTLAGYQTILDLYDQIDSRKWEMEWSAEVVRFYLERRAESQRTLFWYIWRGLLSLLLVGAGLFLTVVLGRVTLRPIRKRPGLAGWKRGTLFLAYLGGTIFLWLGITVGTLTSVWGALFGIDRFGSVFSETLFSIGDKEVNLFALGGLFGVIALTMAVNKVIGRFLDRQIFPYFTWDIGVRTAVKAVFRYVILFGGIALGLEFVGIGFGVLAVFAGVIGIGIGFGLQSIAANFISGLTLLFERPIKKGDFVDAGGLEGRVEEIRTRATKLITRDKVAVIVPNSEFISGRVVNWSHGTEDVRLHVPVGVAYGSDVQLVTTLLLATAKKNQSVLYEPAPEVWFMGFGDSSLDFELLVWTRDIQRKYHTISELNYAIDATFRENNVKIPFPQHDVHMVKDEE